MKSTPLFLLVPLAWASLALADPASQQPLSANVWLQSHRTNAADAFGYSRFTLLGKFVTSPGAAAPDRPAFIVDCIPPDESPRSKAMFLAENLLVGTPLKIIYVEPEEIRGISYFPKVAVRYRTDNAKREEEEQWSPTSDKTSASVPKQSLKELLRARSVAITAIDDHGRQVAMQFDMPDPSLVEQSCNVDEH